MKGKIIFFLLLIILISPTLGIAETEVSGVIGSNATWTLAGSPYIVTGNILVSENVELIIEPGVMVKFRECPLDWQEYYIRIDGTLKAEGEQDNPIVFTIESEGYNWGCIGFTDTSVDWDETISTGCILSNCILEYGGVHGGGMNEFSDAIIRCFSSSPMIRNNIIRYSYNDAIRCEGSDHLKIVNNYIYNNKSRGVLMLSGSGVIDNNVIKDNGQGIYLGSMVEDTEITNNTINISLPEQFGACIRIDMWDFSESNVLISNNDIASSNVNSNAISLILQYNISSLENIQFSHNNINNTGGLFCVYLVDGSDNGDKILNMTNNWWGATDENEINQLIYDFNDDFNLPIVDYLPFATEEISESGSTLPPLPIEPPLPSPPTAVAGSDQMVFNEIILDGSLSSDPDGDIVSYVWTVRRREDIIFTPPVMTVEGVNPTISGLTPGFYDISLAVTDSSGLVGTDGMICAAMGRKGDFDQDGDVDGDDLAEFSENFGM